MEGWASVHGDGLQPGVEEALQLPMHASLEETISSLCHLDLVTLVTFRSHIDLDPRIDSKMLKKSSST